MLYDSAAPLCLSICLPAYLTSACLPTCLPPYLPASLPACLPTCLPPYLPARQPAFPPMFPCHQAPGTADMVLSLLGSGPMPVPPEAFLPDGRLLALKDLTGLKP